MSGNPSKPSYNKPYTNPLYNNQGSKYNSRAFEFNPNNRIASAKTNSTGTNTNSTKNGTNSTRTNTNSTKNGTNPNNNKTGVRNPNKVANILRLMNKRGNVQWNTNISNKLVKVNETTNLRTLNKNKIYYRKSENGSTRPILVFIKASADGVSPSNLKVLSNALKNKMPNFNNSRTNKSYKFIQNGPFGTGYYHMGYFKEVPTTNGSQTSGYNNSNNSSSGSNTSKSNIGNNSGSNTRKSNSGNNSGSLTNGNNRSNSGNNRSNNTNNNNPGPKNNKGKGPIQLGNKTNNENNIKNLGGPSGLKNLTYPELVKVLQSLQRTNGNNWRMAKNVPSNLFNNYKPDGINARRNNLMRIASMLNTKSQTRIAREQLG